MSISERLGGHTVSLADLLSGSRPPIAGETGLALGGYVDEILASGCRASAASRTAHAGFNSTAI